MFRRVVLSLVLVLFASLTTGVIVGLDDAARRNLAGRLHGTDVTSASPAPVTPSALPATPKPQRTATAQPSARVSLTPTQKPSSPAKVTPKPSSPPKVTSAPTPSASPTKKPSTAPTSKPRASKKPASNKYLNGPLKKGKGGTVYLTFDDGPGVSTLEVLDILSRTGSTATFFHLGVNEADFPSADARIQAQGSKVANHSYNHPDLTKLTASQLRWQLSHGPRGKCFRPPFGATNAAVRKAIARAGMREVLWSVDTLDWTKPGVTTLAKTGRLKGVSNGTIILMHDGGGDRTQTVAALPTIIADLKARGYQVRALPFC